MQKQYIPRWWRKRRSITQFVIFVQVNSWCLLVYLGTAHSWENCGPPPSERQVFSASRHREYMHAWRSINDDEPKRLAVRKAAWKQPRRQLHFITNLGTTVSRTRGFYFVPSCGANRWLACMVWSLSISQSVFCVLYFNPCIEMCKQRRANECMAGPVCPRYYTDIYSYKLHAVYCSLHCFRPLTFFSVNERMTTLLYTLKDIALTDSLELQLQCLTYGASFYRQESRTKKREVEKYCRIRLEHCIHLIRAYRALFRANAR